MKESLYEKKKIEELEEYSRDLEFLAKNNSEVIFPNRDHKHAAIAMSKILKYSKNDFILFDNDLSGDVTQNEQVESFREALFEFIGRNGSIRIVAGKKYNNGETSELENYLSNLTQIFPERIEVKHASLEFKSKIKEIYNENISFVVGDNNKFRLELQGNDDNCEITREATCSFNNKRLPEKINSVFNSNYSSCTPYFK
ncbi:hypothetical protein [Flavivirga sp. 57AJ16]|uniref:hypothetical protein n=1 Tax=Flavivirga sp. 57AJ16 TaxID=3025307 RepID=UPI0023662446|nr:hypothetical protein [Flavivirga sp. 57AJ16]MDD7887873.1 hypothetical protein [Flavivirga sp. 57AJ16]